MSKKLVIVGFGGMGSYHFRQLKEIEEIEVTGAYDIDQDAKKRIIESDLKNYNSLREITEDKDIEIVLIATPNDSHRDIAVEMMNNKINVICEKPCAMNLKEVREMIECANKNDVKFTVNQNRRFDFDYLTIKESLKKNTIGDVFRIESKVHGSRGIPGDWRGEEKHGGGMMFDWGIHLIDQILLLDQFKIKSLYTTFTHVTNDEVDDGFITEFLCEDNTSILVEVSTCSFVQTDRWRVYGSNGTTILKPWVTEGKHIILDSWLEKDAKPIEAANGLSKTMAPRSENDTTTEIDVEFEENISDIIYKNFVSAIEGKEELVISHESLIKTFDIIEKCFESVKENKVIKL